MSEHDPDHFNPGFEVKPGSAHWLKRFIGRPGHRPTRWVAKFWGRKLGFLYMNEYPKSGGTWFSAMVGDYLRIPYPQHYALPLSFKCVVHNHWHYQPYLTPSFHLHRDGRDVMVSLYFHRIRAIEHARKTKGYNRFDKIYSRLFSKDYDPNNLRAHIFKFLEHELKTNRAGDGLFWHQFIDGWSSKDKVVFVSYENLLTDCAGTLGQAIRSLTGEEPDPVELETSTRRFSFTRMSGGRKQGEIDGKSHMRKGVSGDWANHFTREAGELFHAHAGATLIRLGYVADGEWYKSLPPA